METNEQTKASTSARISRETQASLAEQQLRLSALARRKLNTDEVIQIMQRVFAQQPESVIRRAVQP